MTEASSAMESSEIVPVPPQITRPRMHDFRRAANGPRGYKECVRKTGSRGSKRKLEEYEAEVAAEAAHMDEDVRPAVGAVKKPKANTVGLGKGSGRPWKAPATPAGQLKNPLLSTSWDKKMQVKAEQAAFKSVKREAQAAHKEKLAEAKRRREAAKARKEENQKRSSVTQTISSNSTLRKMMKSKKQRKKLMKADTLQMQG